MLFPLYSKRCHLATSILVFLQEFGFSQQTSGLSVIKPHQKSSLPFRLGDNIHAIAIYLM